MRLGRARHHRRIPLPGRLCCDPARSTSTCCRSHEASAGGPSCACVNRYFHDRADDGHIGLPAAVPSRQSHTREPTVPSGTARKSQIAITASPIRPHQNLQIPITSHLCPAGSCLGGFRTPAPCLSLDLRGPASENLHQVGRSRSDQPVAEADIQSDCTAELASAGASVRGRGGDSERRPMWRCGVGGGGHRPCRLRWSCETSTLAGRGTDDRGKIGAIGAAGEGR